MIAAEHLFTFTRPIQTSPILCALFTIALIL
jgi:hypothetical protein